VVYVGVVTALGDQRGSRDGPARPGVDHGRPVPWRGPGRGL